MANIGQTVSKLIARYGDACLITYPTIGMGNMAQPATSEESSVRILRRRVNVSGSAPEWETVGLLGPTAKPLEGAKITITATGKTYTVKAASGNVHEGSTVRQQVTLK